MVQDFNVIGKRYVSLGSYLVHTFLVAGGFSIWQGEVMFMSHDSTFLNFFHVLQLKVVKRTGIHWQGDIYQTSLIIPSKMLFISCH